MTDFAEKVKDRMLVAQVGGPRDMALAAIAAVYDDLDERTRVRDTALATELDMSLTTGWRSTVNRVTDALRREVLGDE